MTRLRDCDCLQRALEDEAKTEGATYRDSYAYGGVLFLAAEMAGGCERSAKRVRELIESGRRLLESEAEE